MKPIRILIADDHPMIRVALESMINNEPNMIVVGSAIDGPQAVKLFQKHQPDVVLMDINMPGGMNGLEAMHAIRITNPQARFIVLTNYDTDEDIRLGLEAGAMSYLLKDAPQEKLIETIRAVHSGQKLISQTLEKKLARSKADPPLSPREHEILRHIMEGKSNKAISRQLHIAETTVKSHVKNILIKLSVRDRTQAVTKALQRGILSRSEGQQ